jgi:hypothetical protein
MLQGGAITMRKKIIGMHRKKRTTIQCVSLELGCRKGAGFHEDMQHIQFGGDDDSKNYHQLTSYFPSF